MALKQPVVLPPNRTWSQANTGFLFGSLYSTRNIDLGVPGVLSLSKRATYLGREATSGSSFDYLLSIAFDGQALTGAIKYYLISSDKIYTLTQALTGFAIDATASTPQMSLNSSDGIIWNDGLYVTTSTDLKKLVSGTWTSGLDTLDTGLPHPLCQSVINDYLLIGNGPEMLKRTTAGVNSTAITLPDNYRIQWIRSDNSRVLIGTRNMNGGNSAVFDWDESSPAATNRYDIDAPWVYSGEFRNSDFFVVTSDGRILKFNGAGFSEAARFPIYKSLTGIWNSGFNPLSVVFQRGMRMIEGRLTILINSFIQNGQNSSVLYENMPSGLWEFDESTGLNVKYGFSNTTNATDFAQMQLGSGVGAGAVAPVVIDLFTSPPAPTVGSALLYGARVTDFSTSWFTLGTIVTGVNRGQFETTRIETTDIADESMKLWVKYRGLFTSDDIMVFKYKDQYKNGLPFDDTGLLWTSSTSYTSSNSGAGLNYQYVSAGDEVTVTLGNGAGASAHISTIALNAGTWTITLDEAIPGVSNGNLGAAIVDNFTKLQITITQTDVNGYKDIPIPQSNPRDWIQIKGELRGTNYVTIEELQLITGTHVIASS